MGSLHPRLPPFPPTLPTKLCSSFTQTIPLHSYCKQKLCHDKLQNALPGLLGALHGLGWLHFFLGDTSKSTAAALVVSGYRTLVDPEIWVTITKIVRFIHISARFKLKLSMHESEEAHIVSPPYIGLAPRTSCGRPNNASSLFRACCDHVCPPIPLITRRNGSLQLFDRDASIAPLLQANTLPWQTSKCSSAVVAGLFGGWVGVTWPLTEPPSLPQ